MVSEQLIGAMISLEMYRMMLSFGLVLLMFGILSLILQKSKSKKMRELFGDLFVIGTIRKLAKEDNIDLEVELKEMRKMEKLEKSHLRSIDRMVEVELNEKISAKNQEAIAGINKKA